MSSTERPRSIEMVQWVELKRIGGASGDMIGFIREDVQARAHGSEKGRGRSRVVALVLLHDKSSIMHGLYCIFLVRFFSFFLLIETI